MWKSTSKSYQNPSEEEKQKKQKNAQTDIKIFLKKKSKYLGIEDSYDKIRNHLAYKKLLF